MQEEEITNEEVRIRFGSILKVEDVQRNSQLLFASDCMNKFNLIPKIAANCNIRGQMK